MSYQGQTPIIKSPEQLEKSIEAYFAHCERGRVYSWVSKKGELLTGTLSIPPSVESLSLFLGFTDRSALIQYETRNQGHEIYVHTIRRAKSRIAAEKLAMAERGLLNERVVMFDLSVNHGYIQEINVNVNELQQLSQQDRLLLGAVLKHLPGQLRALPQPRQAAGQGADADAGSESDTRTNDQVQDLDFQEAGEQNE